MNKIVNLSTEKLSVIFIPYGNGLSRVFVSNAAEGKTLPLLIEDFLVDRAEKNLKEIFFDKDMPFELFQMTVAGCIVTLMKDNAPVA